MMPRKPKAFLVGNRFCFHLLIQKTLSTLVKDCNINQVLIRWFQSFFSQFRQIRFSLCSKGMQAAHDFRYQILKPVVICWLQRPSQGAKKVADDVGYSDPLGSTRGEVFLFLDDFFKNTVFTLCFNKTKQLQRFVVVCRSQSLQLHLGGSLE